MAMHSAVLLADENRQLWTENEREKRKKAQRRSYITQGGVLTIQEALDQSQKVNLQLEEGFTDQPAQSQIRALRTCSICRLLEYTARTCI